VTEFTDQYAAVLSDLEERKASLKSRLESLDATIAGLRALAALPSPQVSASGEGPANQVPVRELPKYSAEQPVLRRDEHFSMSAPSATRNESLFKRVPEANTSSRADRSNELQERRATRRGGSTIADARRPAGLNVYVNQNAEWAARQLVPASSPRAIFRQSTGHRCPKCGSQDTRVSTTRGLSDLFMFLFEYSVGRCRNCDTRFRIWQARDEESSGNELSEAATATE
jgi:hypothetical protein